MQAVECIVSQINGDMEEIFCKGIRNTVRESYGVSMSKSSVSCVKKMVIKKIQREVEIAFHHLQSYLVKIMEDNPGSYNKVEKDCSNRFTRCILIPSICIEALRNCKKFLVIDGLYYITII